MRLMIECKDLGKEDLDYVSKGLKSYLELFDMDAVVSVLQLSDVEMITALNKISEKVLELRSQLEQHTAIGNPQHLDVV